MKILIIIFSAFFIVGCGIPIQLTSENPNDQTPEWVSDLASRVDNEQKNERGKIRNPKAKAKKPVVENKTVNDMVTPKVVQPDPVEKPEWVSDLEEKVTVKKIGKTGKKQRSPGMNIDQDLVGEKKEVTDEVVQTPLPPYENNRGNVDIVFIVDSSPSMSTFLKKAGERFKQFIPSINHLDWRIMFTTADYGDHGFFLVNWAARKGKAMNLEDDGTVLYKQKYLSKSVKNYGRVFLDTLREHTMMDHYYENYNNDQEMDNCSLPPYCQGWNEQPLRALQASFSKNKDFFRENANVAAVIFSDGDEGLESDEIKRTKAEYVVDTFKDIWKDDQKKLVSYGIIMRPDLDEECIEKYQGFFHNGEGVIGKEIAKFTDLTGGKNYSLCSEDYTDLAKQIAMDFE